MSYKLNFIPISKKEWDKLGSTIKIQFKKKIKQRLENPRVPKDKLSGYSNIYKIKLKNLGYSLAYEVKDDKLIILVLVVDKRENNDIYNALGSRVV